MVGLAATVGFVLYRLLSWNLCRDCGRDKRNVSHKYKKNDKE